jgi:hypothetical protein
VIVVGVLIFFYLEGKLKMTFTWGLGTSTKNKFEDYALLKGFTHTIEINIKLLIVIGYLSIIIKIMVMNLNKFEIS